MEAAQGAPPADAGATARRRADAGQGGVSVLTRVWTGREGHAQQALSTLIYSLSSLPHAGLVFEIK